MADSPADRPTIFLSYAREDGSAAERLRGDLQQAGRRVWFDREKLLGGRWFRREIARAIKTCSFFLPLLSNRSVSKRGTVQWEMKQALKVVQESPEEAIFIIPVRLDQCEPSYGLLHEIHWIDMFPDWEAGIQEILRATAPVRGVAGAADKPLAAEQTPGVEVEARGWKTLQPVELTPVVLKAVSEAEDYASSRGIQIRLVNSLANAQARVHEEQLELILANILQNAVKYTYVVEGSGAGWVRVEAIRRGNRARIGVENWGKPFKGRQIKGVLAGERGALTAKGTGYSLYLAKALLETNGGGVTVKSQPGRWRVAGRAEDELWVTEVGIEVELEGDRSPRP